MSPTSKSNSKQPLPRAGGFTLIEVMIVVAIIGILAAVAVPAYNDYVRRGQLTEAFNALSDYRTRMEQYFQDNRNYGTGTTCGVALPTGAAAKYFNYGCAPSTTPPGYVMTARGASGNAAGHEYTINQNGDRNTTQFKGSSITATCWLTKDASC